ncbi:MAG TPA: hypothetical protein VKT77_11575 [Chthonomonadaceae bacterium]|nr:hypothetical protein [Chthonomonadaceae bacterium]
MSQSVAEIGPITVTDVSGQKSYRVEKMPSDATVDEIVARLLAPMQQPTMDPEGRPLAYAVRSEREDRYLGANERLGDALQPDDTLRLMPTVDAGRG